MAPFIYVEASAEAAAMREREFIEEKMNAWVKAVDALNEASKAFSKYYFCEKEENFIKKKEREITKLNKAEKDCRRDLAMQIAFCTTREEHAQFKVQNHGQVIDWLVRQPFSPLPEQASRWAWVKERTDVTCCNPGPYTDPNGCSLA